jgi:hypothetical protein
MCTCKPGINHGNCQTTASLKNDTLKKRMIDATVGSGTIVQAPNRTMAKIRNTPEAIIHKLREVEILQGQGKTVAQAVKHLGITEQTFYRWRKAFGLLRDQSLQHHPCTLLENPFAPQGDVSEVSFRTLLPSGCSPGSRAAVGYLPIHRSRTLPHW